MGTGQKVAIAGMVVLTGAVVAYYAMQEPVDNGNNSVAMDTTAQLPDPEPNDGSAATTDPSLTSNDDEASNVDLRGVEHLLQLTEPPKPLDESTIQTTSEPGDQEPLDSLTQTSENTDSQQTDPVGPGDDDETADPEEATGADDTGEPADDVVIVDKPVDDDPRTLIDDPTIGTDESTVRINTLENPEGDAAEDSTDDLERYTVEDGDSMWIIARKKLGSGAKWQLIAKANPLVDPMKIKKGDVLIIPKLEPERGPIAEKTERDPLGLGFNEDEKVVEVLEGDSLWKIAEREYKDGTKWRIIYTANKTRMKSESDLRPGQKLVIPPLPRE
jgi:nucleoid-associated protein YgaU